MTVSSSAAASVAGPALATEPLEARAFAPFGDVLPLSALAAASVNEARGVRRDLPQPPAQPGLRDVVAFYDLAPSLLPVRVTLVERHPLTAQMFLPLDVARWLVVVMPSRPDGSPDAGAARAFRATADQAIVYAAGIWHLPLVALDRPGQFLMRMGEAGSPDDCHEHNLESPLHVLG